MSIPEYIDILTSDDPRAKKFYMVSTVDRLPEPLRSDVIPHPLSCDDGTSLMSMYLGRDTYAQAHYHPESEAFLTQVFGQKRIVLYPPDQTPKLYPGAWWSPSAFNHTEVNFIRPDLQKHPRFADAASVECVLSPGDTLYIPLHWWHAIWGVGVNASVTEQMPALERDVLLRPLGVSGLAGLLSRRVVSSIFHVYAKARSLQGTGS
jgi:hypothetical protein